MPGVAALLSARLASVMLARELSDPASTATSSHVRHRVCPPGLDGQRARGALVHGLRHTYATELANADVSVYTLMKLLGHESMTTSQRYVSGAGTENRGAAAQNPLYELIQQPISKSPT